MLHYYNENDREAAEWLRQLIDQGSLPSGEVDERSIADVAPDDLVGFDQCHFFAGIGALALAAQRAGLDQTSGVWTGSCPCQSLSNTGKRKGFSDPRHLWPTWYPLIQARRPRLIFGEQVGAPLAIGKVGRKAIDPIAEQDGWAWLDLVQNDLEDAHYAVGHSTFPACGVGAPHIRSRLYFVAHSNDPRLQGFGVRGNGADQQSAGQGGLAGGLVYTDSPVTEQPSWGGSEPLHAEGTGQDDQPDRSVSSRDGRGAVNGFWSDADWLWCKDERWRAIEPFLEPLVDRFDPRMGSSGDPGLPDVAATAEARVLRLRGYGNAVVIHQAQLFIETAMEAL